MKVTIDRFEGEYALCEQGTRTMIRIEKGRLPPGAKEGDILEIDGDQIKIDLGQTASKKKALQERLDQLWKK